MADKKKKILCILHIPPPIHGAAIVGEFIKESKFINNLFQLRYLNLSTSKAINEIGNLGFSKWIIFLKLVFSVINSLVFYNPNIVYLSINSMGLGFYKDLVIVCLVKMFKIPLVLHFHNIGVSLNQKKIIDNFFYKFVFNNSKVILLSKYLFFDVKKYVDNKNIFYCPNGLPKLKYRQKQKKNFQNVQLLFFSNLLKSKGVYLLLDALKVLRSKKINFTCNFVGEIGDIDESQFNKKVVDLQLSSSVNYLGAKFGKEKFEIFSNSDVFIHPSYNDCFPLVLLEASQFRLPIISTLEGAIPEIIDDGVNGFLVSKNNIFELARKIEILIKDKSLRICMGDAAFNKYCEKYTLEKFESRISNILNNIKCH